MYIYIYTDIYLNEKLLQNQYQFYLFIDGARKNKVLTYEITLSDSQARREKAAKPPT